MRPQAHGLSLSIGQVIEIAITATLAAIGAASIPMSALVSMITVLQARPPGPCAGSTALPDHRAAGAPCRPRVPARWPCRADMRACLSLVAASVFEHALRAHW